VEKPDLKRTLIGHVRVVSVPSRCTHQSSLGWSLDWRVNMNDSNVPLRERDSEVNDVKMASPWRQRRDAGRQVDRALSSSSPVGAVIDDLTELDLISDLTSPVISSHRHTHTHRRRSCDRLQIDQDDDDDALVVLAVTTAVIPHGTSIAGIPRRRHGHLHRDHRRHRRENRRENVGVSFSLPQ